MKRHDPPDVAAPFSNYTNAIEIDEASRWLHVSGQVGVDAGGRLHDGFEAQCRTALTNIGALLTAAGMGFEHVVKLGVYLTSAGDIPAYRRLRDEIVKVPTASSLVIVAGLAHPDWLVEIDAVAAAPLAR